MAGGRKAAALAACGAALDCVALACFAAALWRLLRSKSKISIRDSEPRARMFSLEYAQLLT